MLGLFTIGFFGLLLSLATGGYFVYVVGAMAAVVLIGAMHYALWGRMLDESTAAEREKEQEPEENWLHERREDDGRFRPRRFGE
jgi:hypothetical protein